MNADGSTTIDNVALNADGSVAFSRLLNTSADGSTKILSDLNAAGVVTRLQMSGGAKNLSFAAA